MTTYHCPECGDFVSDDDLVGSVEPHGETLFHCPCGCYDLEDTSTCDFCGELFAASEITDDCCLTCSLNPENGVTL